ncbi:hypothetical protein BC829DRAFT_168790 [Chytridium lagenaria]|nr:hypothetical protein BC829DRAFT_168790 [Chytridium lagenaria]
MIDNLLPNLHRYLLDRRATTLNIVGHSLGAAIGSIFTMMVRDMGVLIEMGEGDGSFGGSGDEVLEFWVSALCELGFGGGGEEVFAFVNESDVVPTLGYGTMVDLRETIIKGAELLRTPKLSDASHPSSSSSPSNPLTARKIHRPHRLYPSPPNRKPPSQMLHPRNASPYPQNRDRGSVCGTTYTGSVAGHGGGGEDGWGETREVLDELAGWDVEETDFWVVDEGDGWEGCGDGGGFGGFGGGGLRASPVPEDPMGTGALPAAVPLKTAERYVVERILDRTTLGTIKVG